MTNMWTEDTNKISLLKAAIDLDQFPRYVYKYRPISKFTERIFKDSNIWFAKPNTFNDPFDCQIITKTDNTKEELKEFLIRNNAYDINKKIDDGLLPIEEWNNGINKVIGSFINNCGVACFAGNNDSILMWSHYTDSHKGICIKFDILEDLNLFMLPLKVNYSDEYPIYNHIRDNRKSLIDKLFQTKAKCWEYENEIRVMKPNQFGNIKFNKSAIKEICFGVNASERDIKYYKHLLSKNSFPNVKYTKAEVANDKFILNIINL